MADIRADRKTLSHYNIVYEEKLVVDSYGRCLLHPFGATRFSKSPHCTECSLWNLPNHVDAVREVLLDLTGVLSSSARSESVSPFQAKPTLSDLLPYHAFYSESMNKSDLDLERTFLQQCRNTSNATSLLKTVAPILLQDWTEYYRQHFLKPMVDRFQNCKGIASHYRASYSYDSFVWTHNKAWSSSLVQAVGEQTTGKLETPCPTFAFYFSVLHGFDCIVSPSRTFSVSAPARNLSNFQDGRLERFVKAGLKPSPFGKLRSSLSSADESDRASYPWLIVQVEVDGNEEDCICRAAISAAASLEMYRILSKYADNDTFQQIPPIPVLTATGSVVRLWLAYMGNTLKTQMVCIWTGTLKEMIAVLHLQVILDNLHTWAMRCLRPCIESYLEQWRLRHMSSEHQNASPSENDDPKAVKKRADQLLSYKSRVPAEEVTQSKNSAGFEMKLTPALETVVEEMINRKLGTLLETQPLRKDISPRQSQSHSPVEPNPRTPIHEDQQNLPIPLNTKPARPETPPPALPELHAVLTPPTTPSPNKLSKNISPISAGKPTSVSKHSSSPCHPEKELLLSIQELKIK